MTLKWLLEDGGGFLQINHSATDDALRVRVDRSKIFTHGKLSIGRLLLRLHIYRCTADVDACRALYEDLSAVDGEFLAWRDVVLQAPRPKPKFVQANTFLGTSGNVILKEYEPTNEGIIRSWADRNI